MGTPPSASNPARDLLTRNWAGVSDEKAATEVGAEVDLESAKLWDLSASDLAEIQRSLKELTDKDRDQQGRQPFAMTPRCFSASSWQSEKPSA